MTKGDRVTLPGGRQGTVTGVYREAGCGCRSVIVRVDGGREWAGKESEVRRP